MTSVQDLWLVRIIRAYFIFLNAINNYSLSNYHIVEFTSEVLHAAKPLRNCYCLRFSRNSPHFIFIALIKTARHLSLSWATSISSRPFLSFFFFLGGTMFPPQYFCIFDRYEFSIIRNRLAFTLHHVAWHLKRVISTLYNSIPRSVLTLPKRAVVMGTYWWSLVRDLTFCWPCISV